MGNQAPLFDDGPSVCFNPAKNWQLGWYSDNHLTIENGGTTSYIGPMDGITVNPASAVNPQVVKLNTASAVDYYVGFNRATSFNNPVEGRDQVVVVKQGAEGNGFALSFLQVAPGTPDGDTLPVGPILSIPNFDNTGLTMTVEYLGMTGEEGNVRICLGTCPTGTPTAAPIEPCPIACNTVTTTSGTCEYEVTLVCDPGWTSDISFGCDGAGGFTFAGSATSSSGTCIPVGDTLADKEIERTDDDGRKVTLTVSAIIASGSTKAPSISGVSQIILPDMLSIDICQRQNEESLSG